MLPTYSPLLTDLYELTMAYGYYSLGMHEQEAVFHLLFRKTPFGGNYALNCGLQSVIDFISQWQFQENDLAFLATLKNYKNEPLFSNDFLQYLKKLSFTCDIDAIAEGTIVFAQLPLLRIKGPLLQCQLIETALLNIINFQTLIATKASRVCQAANGEPVIEFGMRRAQGPDGAVSAARAAYIGGCIATSNTLAGKLYDIPLRGTHAHSWITAFDNEKAAFAAYASIMPNNCVLLVDTYNTIQGVNNAITIGKELKKQGAKLAGIRLDSGDLAKLSIKAREMLDAQGFQDTDILASNSLDEYVITSLKQQHAKISAWGVGTNLATAYDQPALDGVYKLSALKDKSGKWIPKIKLSEQLIKVSNPGVQQVRRYFHHNEFFTDIIYDIELGIEKTASAISLLPGNKPFALTDYDSHQDLLKPIYRQGKLVAKMPTIHEVRNFAGQEINLFCQRQIEKPYQVALERKLYNLKQDLIKQIR